MNYLENAHLELLRAKRDVSVSQPQLPSPSPSQPSSQPAPSVASSVSPVNTSIDKVSQIDTPKIENGVRLLGVNGTGQRKDYSTVNGKTILDVPSKSLATTSDNKSSTINKSLGAVQSTKSTEQPINDDEEKLIDEIDEPEEAINKTVDEHLMNQTHKTDYFQYYNSTTITDKNKSDEYWAEKKDYIISGILSKSHRRAIVSSVLQIFKTVLHQMLFYIVLDGKENIVISNHSFPSEILYQMQYFTYNISIVK